MQRKAFIVIFFLIFLIAITAHGDCQVQPHDGSLIIAQTDIELTTPLGPLPLTRHYIVDTQTTLFGKNWSFELLSRLWQKDENTLYIFQGDQALFVLNHNQADYYTNEEKITAQKQTIGWRVTYPDQSQRIYNEMGVEIERHDAHGNRITFSYDNQDRLSQIEAVAGYPLKFSYDDNEHLIAIQDYTNKKCDYIYDEKDRLIKAIDSNGWAVTYEYTPDGRLKALIDARNGSITFEYDTQGRVIKQIEKPGHTASFQYTDTKTKIADESGYWIEIEYDTERRPLLFHDSLARKQKWTWDDKGHLIKEIPFDQIPVYYTYDEASRIITIKTDSNDVLHITYFKDTQLPLQVDDNGAVTQYTYDKAGRLISATSPSGRKISFTYDNQGRQSAYTDGLGRATLFTYDQLGRLIRQKEANGAMITWEYDLLGRLGRFQDSTGSQTSFTYFDNGLLASIKTNQEPTINFQYDDKGNLLTEQSNDHQTEYIYDDKGYLAQIAYPDQTRELFKYDKKGNVLSFTNRNEQTTTYQYDPIGRLTLVKQDKEQPIEYTYAPNGQISRIQAGSNKTEFNFDPQKRIWRKIEGDQKEVQYHLDQWERVTQSIYPNGATEQSWYDFDGFLESIIRPMGDVWGFAYNQAGQLKKVVFPNIFEKAEQHYEYNQQGQLKAIIDPLNRRRKFKYNDQGLLITQTNQRGQSIIYTYDGLGALIQKKTPTENWLYRYDQSGNIVEAKSRDFIVQYMYDHKQRLTQISYPHWDKIYQYRYNDADRSMTHIDPEGRKTRFKYDANGHIVQIKPDGLGSFKLDYDPKGRLIQKETPNQITTRYTYNDQDQFIKIEHLNPQGGAIATRQYQWDTTGGLFAIIDQKGQTQQFKHDKEGRIIEEKSNYGHRSYQYGRGGNRFKVKTDNKQEEYRYDAAGQMLVAGDLTFEYDADGNMIAQKRGSNATRFFYDAENKLVRVEINGSKIITYGYGPFGERLWREEDDKRIYFIYNEDNLWQEVDSKGQTITNYIYLTLDRPLVVNTSNQDTLFFHEDILGSILAVTNAHGQPIAQYAYDAFGNIIWTKGNATIQPLGFSGRPIDLSTGLYDWRARFYDPQTGRFISPDPLTGESEIPESFNPYLFAYNKPFEYVDPFGLRGKRYNQALSWRNQIRYGSPFQKGRPTTKPSIPVNYQSKPAPPLNPIPAPPAPGMSHKIIAPPPIRRLTSNPLPPSPIRRATSPHQAGRVPTIKPPPLHLKRTNLPLYPSILTGRGRPLPNLPGGPGPCEVKGGALAAALQRTAENLQVALYYQLKGGHIPRWKSEITARYPAGVPVRVRTSYLQGGGGDWIYPTRAKVEDLGPYVHKLPVFGREPIDLLNPVPPPWAGIKGLDPKAHLREPIQEQDLGEPPLPDDVITIGPAGPPYTETEITEGTDEVKARQMKQSVAMAGKILAEVIADLKSLPDKKAVIVRLQSELNDQSKNCIKASKQTTQKLTENKQRIIDDSKKLKEKTVKFKPQLNEAQQHTTNLCALTEKIKKTLADSSHDKKEVTRLIEECQALFKKIEAIEQGQAHTELKAARQTLESDIHEAEKLLAEIKNRQTDARQNKQAIAKTAQDLTKQIEQYNLIIKSTPSKLAKVREYSQPWIQMDKQAALYHEQSYNPQYSSNKPIEIPPTIADAPGSCSEEEINPLVSELMQIVKNAKSQLTQADQFNSLKIQAQQCFTAAQQLSAKQEAAFEGTISGVVTGMCKGEDAEYAVKGTFTINIFPNGDVTGTFAGDDEGAIKGKIDPKGNVHAGGGRADSYIWEGTIWQLKGKQGLAGKGTWHGINILDDNCGGEWHSN